MDRAVSRGFCTKNQIARLHRVEIFCKFKLVCTASQQSVQ